jgi:hypothetical protein
MSLLGLAWLELLDDLLRSLWRTARKSTPRLRSISSSLTLLINPTSENPRTNKIDLFGLPGVDQGGEFGIGQSQFCAIEVISLVQQLDELRLEIVRLLIVSDTEMLHQEALPRIVQGFPEDPVS